VQGQYAFLRNCCPYFAVSGNLSAAPNETLGNHRRQSQTTRLELGYVSAVDLQGRTIWIADAHRDDGKHFVVRAEEKLTGFVELQSVIRASGEFS
jgi:hypothetical protein